MLLANKKLELEKHFSDAVRTLTISTDNFYLVAGGNEGKIVKYNLNTPENYETFNSATYGSSGFRKVVFSPDNKLLIAGSKNGEILLWNSDAVNLKPINYNISNDIISNILFYENQKFIVSTYSGKLIFFEYNGLIIKMLTEINISKKIVEFDLNLSNTKIVIATESGEILIYNISTKEKEMEYISDAGKISTINWYSENKLLVGYSIGLVEDINITSKKIIKKWFAHNSAVSAVIYSFINDWIITAGYDGKIKIWKNKSIKDEPIEIKGHTTWIYSIVLDKNEKKLISADALGKIIISEIDIEELKAEIRSKVSKNMSKENWIKFVGEGIDYSESLPEIN
jgi:WD40 repeat protein